MDIFALVAVIFIVLLGAVAVAAIMMQQNGQLSQIQDKLSKLSKGNEAPLNPEGLRVERAGIVDPLVLLEVSLGQSDSVELTEEQLQQIDVARSNIKKISEQLKSAEEWMGPPYDLEWVELLDRMPRLKIAYQKISMKPDQ
jgi:preprotein translocase subunit YajC